MKQLTFYFDVVSPYAYLAFERLPEALIGISHRVRYKPVLLGALLKARGQRGPAELPGKREWTYRQVQWLAHDQGVALDLPPVHPFNPLALLRLAVACDAHGEPNRYVCETVLRHVWQGGAVADDPQRLRALTEALAPARDPQDAAVKAALRAHTDEAQALGLFGVPSIVVDGRVFWGLDALPMLRAYLQGDPWFDGPAWADAERIAPPLVR